MSSHEHIEGNSNKVVALLISVLALLLAIVGGFGKYYQTQVVTQQVELSDTWNFYQAKSIRQSNTKLSLELLDVLANNASPKVTKLRNQWESQIAHYESDPDKNNGKKELSGKAEGIEKSLHIYNDKYHYLEFAAAILEIAIVLASASIIVSMNFLTVIAGLMGICSTLLLAYITLFLQ